MNDSLSEDDRRSLVVYRIDRAFQTIKEAEVLQREGFWNAAINRLYYACFYSCQALFVHDHLSAKSHAGTKTMLGLHYISKQKLPMNCGVTFNTLFSKRHSGDYDDFAYNDAATVSALLPAAIEFVNAIRDYVGDQQ